MGTMTDKRNNMKITYINPNWRQEVRQYCILLTIRSHKN